MTGHSAKAQIKEHDSVRGFRKRSGYMRRRLGRGRVGLLEDFGWFYDTHERRPTPLIPTVYNIKIQN